MPKASESVALQTLETPKPPLNLQAADVEAQHLTDLTVPSVETRDPSKLESLRRPFAVPTHGSLRPKTCSCIATLGQSIQHVPS